MDVPVELRQLRYFVAVAEELHFGRAAERLRMSQSPLSRAIRELERELGFDLFVRTTRRVELTPAGVALLDRTRRALAEVDGAIADARRAVAGDNGVVGIGYGPFSDSVAARIASTVSGRAPELETRLDEELTPDALRRVAARELAGAVVMNTPSAARRYGIRIDTLRDEPLLAAMPASHELATARAVPIGAFAAERVLLPREPNGQVFNTWLEAAFRAEGVELERVVRQLSVPWDHRLLPVAAGDAVTVLVADWVAEPIPNVVAVPFDPPLTFPTDLATCWPPSEAAEALVDAARSARDAEGWLTHRRPRTELPDSVAAGPSE